MEDCQKKLVSVKPETGPEHTRTPRNTPRIPPEHP